MQLFLSRDQPGIVSAIQVLVLCVSLGALLILVPTLRRRRRRHRPGDCGRCAGFCCWPGQRYPPPLPRLHLTTR